jgi:hypothetical protein
MSFFARMVLFYCFRKILYDIPGEVFLTVSDFRVTVTAGWAGQPCQTSSALRASLRLREDLPVGVGVADQFAEVGLVGQGFVTTSGQATVQILQPKPIRTL